MLENRSNSNSASNGSGRHFLFRRRELLIAVSFAGICLSLFLGWVFHQRESQYLSKQFSSDANDRIQALKSAFSDRIVTLRLVASYYAGSEEIERHEFRTFIKEIGMLSENADIEFVAWLPRVSDGLRGEFEKQMEKDGFAEGRIREWGEDGKLRPAAVRGEYYPMMFVEPQEEFRSLIGYDLAADAAAQRAIERVMASKHATVAECNVPGPNGAPQKAVCLFEYAHANPLDKERAGFSRRLDTGVVVSSIRLRMLTEEAIEPLPTAGVNMYFYDENAAGQTSLLLARPSRAEKNPLPALEHPPEIFGDREYVAPLPVADRQWTVYCVQADSFFPLNRNWEPLSAVFAGFLVTAILVGYMYLLTGRTEQVELLVNQRTEALQISEQRFRRLIDGAGDAFFLHDAEGTILDVNRRACECLGYAREELLRLNIRDIDVQPYKDMEEDLPWNLPEAMYPMTFEGLHRRKNGETFPVEVRLAYQDYGGQRVLLGLARDISERMLAVAALQAEQRLLRQLLELLENDRKLIAYEIHDSLAQQVAGLSIHLQAMQAKQQSDDSAALAMLPKAVELAAQCILETRRLIGGLRPPILDESGVVAAIEYLVGEKRRQEPAEILFHHDVCFRHLAKPLESGIFRITQECLTNACRYSKSNKIEIDLKQQDGTLYLRVQDWGMGFDSENITGEHLGLRGIRERARLLGGKAEIVSVPDAGTTVTVELPVVERSIENGKDGD